MKSLKNRSWLLLADGEPFAPSKLEILAQEKSTLVLDGAYSTALNAHLNIDILLGDFDTISPQDLAQAQISSCLNIIHIPDQNKTDLEKGLDYLVSLDAKSIQIAAATGHRLQHTLYNLRLLKKYHRPSPMDQPYLLMVSETETIRYIENTELTITGKTGESLALFGFPQAMVSSTGLKYEMQNYFLDFEKTSSVSNALAQKQVWIRVEGSALLIHEPSPYPLP